MSFTFVESAGNGGIVSSTVVTMTAAPTDGQLLIATIGAATADTSGFVFPSGFTVADAYDVSNRSVATAYKIASSETDSFTFSFGASVSASASVRVFDVVGTVAVGVSSQAIATNLSSVTAPALSSNAVGSLLIANALNSGTYAATFDNSFTQVESVTAGGQAATNVAHKVATGTSETVTATIPSSTLRQSIQLVEFTVTGGASASIDVGIPSDINLKWDTTYQLAVTHDGGTTTLDNVTLSAPTGWETVTFTTAPDEASTESFYEKAKTDATLGGGGYTMVAGDVLAWTTSTGLTIDGQTIPVVDPAATVTGSYKIWDDTLSTWSATSTYTITDNGIYTGEPANDATAIVQPMISNMIKDMVN